MCKVMEERVKAEKISMAIIMLQDGKLSNEDIAKYTSLSLETVNALAKGLKDILA